MANRTDQEVNLHIRATNFSKKTTDEVVDGLRKLIGAQNDQIEAAKKGTTQVSQLESSYKKLEGAVNALVSQNALVKMFQSQGTAITDLETRLAAARKAQNDYAQQAAQVQKKYSEFASERLAEYQRTEGSHKAAMQRLSQEWKAYKQSADAQGQSTEQTRLLARAVAQAEKDLARAQKRIETTKNQLADFGIAADDVAGSQQRIVAAVEEGNAALRRQEEIIDGFDGFAKQRREAQEMIEQRERQIKADETFARAERDLARAIDAERRAQQEANEVAAMNRAQQQADVDILFSNAQREAAEAINKKTAALNLQRQAMLQAAEQAERMSRGTSATARGTAAVSMPNVAQTVRDIQNPADAAVRTVDGLGAAIQSLETRISAINGPIRNYRQLVDDTTRANRALNDAAGRIDGYRQQLAAVRDAATEYNNARAAVARLVAEMRSGAAGDDVTTRLSRAQGTLQRATENVGQLRTGLRQMAAEMQRDGVDVNNLVAAEQRLVAQAQRATASINELAAAHRQHGVAANESGSALLRWLGGSNSSVLSAQQLRGELTSLVSTFLGIYAAIEGVKKILDSFNESQSVMNRLLVVNGADAKAAAADYAYLQAAADRIGIDFAKTAPAFSKFAIAAKQAGRSTNETRFIFEKFAKAGANLNLSAVETERMFKALEQMFNKGKVSAEELTQQLGDVLPGAYNLFANAAGKTTQDFAKMMEAGLVQPSLLIKVAQQLGDVYDKINAGTETLSQSQARYNNAMNRFLTNTAKGGFVEAYQGFLRQVTTLLNDGTADKFAQQLSSALVAVVNVMKIVIDNAGLIKVAVEAILALKLLTWLASLPRLIVAARTELVLLNGQFTAFSNIVGRQMVAATTALSFQLGAAGLGGVVTRLTPLLVTATNAMKGLAAAIPYVGLAYLAAEGINAGIDKFDESRREGYKKVVREATKATIAMQDAEDALEKARGEKRSNDEISRLEKELKQKQDLFRKASAAEAQADKAARAGSGIMNDENLADFQARQTVLRDRKLRAKQAGGTAYPGDPDDSVANAATITKKLESEKTKIERAAQIERLKAVKGDLAARLALIDQEYDDDRKQAQETIKDEKVRRDTLAAIDAASLRKQAVERAKYNNEQSKLGEQENKRRLKLASDLDSKLRELETTAVKNETDSDLTNSFEARLSARVAAVRDTFRETQNKIDELNRLGTPQAKAQAADDQRRLDALVAQKEELERQNGVREEANRLVDVYNKKQGILNNQLAAVKTQVESGEITPEAGLEATNKQIQELGPGIQAAGKAAQEFAISVSSMLDPTRFAEIIATIQQGTAKNNVDRQIAVNNLTDAQRALNELTAQEQREIDAINQKRSLNLITLDQQADAINEVRARYASQIIEQTDALLSFIEAARTAGGYTKEQLDQMTAAVMTVRTNVQNGLTETHQFEQTLVGSVVNNGTTAFESMAEAIGKVVTGQESIAGGFRGMLQAAGAFFASVLRDIAMLIIRQQILNALQSLGGPVGAAASAVQAGGHHTGGIAGGQATFRRTVDSAAFLGAPRYHTGGIAGFAPNEVPAILQRGEEVLTRDDPRHILNAGAQMAAAGASSSEDKGTRIVLVDDRSKVPQAMASSEGERVIVEAIKNNLPTLRRMLK